MALAERLPDFPWDTLADARRAAEAYPGGIVDLSVGTPVDPTPRLAVDALVAASDSPGYPTVWGDASTRAAILKAMERDERAAGAADRTQISISLVSS